MGKIEQVTIGLPLDVVAAVEKAVKAGDYPSVNDAVLDALLAWKEARENFGHGDAELGALWDAGIASGRGKFQTADEIIAEGKRRAQAKP